MRKLRRRYVLFRLHIDGKKIEEKSLMNAIWNNLLSLYGELASADSRLYLTDFDEKLQTGILQCNAVSLREVVTAATLVDSIENTPVCLEPLKTAGTIKSLRRQYGRPKARHQGE